MKKSILALFVFSLCAAGQTLSQAERDQAIRYLNNTRETFLKSLEGLTADQWSFKPSPEVWSVAEAAEHITLSEASLMELIQKKILTAPVSAELAAKARGNDLLVVGRVVDRSVRAKAPEFLFPKSSWTQAAMPAEFIKRRDSNIEWVRATQDDLRGHALPSQTFGGMDAYQYLLLIAAHSQRHTAQIEEVKSHPRFPRPATLTPAERDKAISHLEKTRAAFLASIQGLSAEQWKFKPSPEVWSVAETAEHIAVSEAGIFELVQKKILAAPVDAAMVAESRGKDDMILQRVPDRSQKAQAPEFLQPKSRWTQAELPGAFQASRGQTIAFVKATQDNLRGHATPHPIFKSLDAYQWVLLLSAHSERHTAQINEVKAHANFPKK